MCVHYINISIYQIQGLVNAKYIRDHLKQKPFIKIRDSGDMPMVAWSIHENNTFDVFDLEDRLKMRGWHVPTVGWSQRMP